MNEWTQAGIWIAAWQKLLGHLDQFRRINWDDAIADGAFAAAKKGALPSATPR
ncbi:hypothetical protein SH668x_000279 [Planctomicrobium sp. SH668]|uniref:hypothetical protein n=1 Tax=Planctomicrobium sp. SH668 TaxID=3448126 RepID=UPI003F5C4707